MPNFKSISFKMAVLQGGRQNVPPPPYVCVTKKTPCGIGLRPVLLIAGAGNNRSSKSGCLQNKRITYCT